MCRDHRALTRASIVGVVLALVACSRSGPERAQLAPPSPAFAPPAIDAGAQAPPAPIATRAAPDAAVVDDDLALASVELEAVFILDVGTVRESLRSYRERAAACFEEEIPVTRRGPRLIYEGRFTWTNPDFHGDPHGSSGPGGDAAGVEYDPSLVSHRGFSRCLERVIPDGGSIGRADRARIRRATITARAFTRSAARHFGGGGTP